MKNKLAGARNSLILTAFRTYRLTMSDIAKLFVIPIGDVRTVIKARMRLDQDIHENGN